VLARYELRTARSSFIKLNYRKRVRPDHKGVCRIIRKFVIEVP